MKLLQDPYKRLYVRVAHLTWGIKLTEESIWFDHVSQPEQMYTEVPAMLDDMMFGFTCEGYLEPVHTVQKISTFNARFRTAVANLCLGSQIIPWYPDQLRVTSRWAPAITIAERTYEASAMYGDTIRIWDVGTEKAFQLRTNYVVLSGSGRILMPVPILKKIPDTSFGLKRIAVPWVPLVNFPGDTAFYEQAWKEVLK